MGTQNFFSLSQTCDKKKIYLSLFLYLVKELFSEKALFNELVQPTRQKRFESTEINIKVWTFWQICIETIFVCYHRNVGNHML